MGVPIVIQALLMFTLTRIRRKELVLGALVPFGTWCLQHRFHLALEGWISEARHSSACRRQGWQLNTPSSRR
jgi:hypothetical protein